MTSLLPSRTSARRSAAEVKADLATRRPVALVATGAGAVAAASTLLVCLALGVVGWFLTDSGAHGTPRDGLRTGALAWLLAHGSGVHVEGVAITAMPLGLTLVAAWTCWRLGHKLGASISGHGPDADEIADGQRDWTVPVAAGLFFAGYVVVAVVTATLASTAATAPSTARVVFWSLLLSGLAAAPGIAVGAGRAAIWASYVPPTAVAALAVARRVVLAWLALGLLAFLVALAVDFSTAVNVMSQLHTDAGAAVLIVLVSLLIVPNATLFSGSYLLGPGFAVGKLSVVSPGSVVLGPLPAFPMLAALPDDGAPPDWTRWLVVVPYLVAFAAVVLVQRRMPTQRYDEGAIRGGVGGIAGGIVFGLLAGLAGGAVGPGRMSEVGPFTFDVLLNAITSFGVGGLLGGLAMTWWQRRDLRLADDSVLGDGLGDGLVYDVVFEPDTDDEPDGEQENEDR